MSESNEQEMSKTKNLKFWWGRYCGNTKALFKHPIQYAKGYIKDFIESDLKGKIKNIGLTILFIFVSMQLYQLVLLAIMFVIAFGGIFGGSRSSTTSYETLKSEFEDKHGRQAQNDYELYHDNW